MEEYIQVITAAASKRNAEEIANELVQNRLVACVQIVGPITSMYWWKGNVEKSTEWLCIAKTQRDLYEAVELSIRRNHPYEIPEVLAVPVIKGSKSYISWLRKELRK